MNANILNFFADMIGDLVTFAQPFGGLRIKTHEKDCIHRPSACCSGKKVQRVSVQFSQEASIHRAESGLLTSYLRIFFLYWFDFLSPTKCP